MPKFSIRSTTELLTCKEDLQELFNEVIKYFDCTIIQGQRGAEEQNRLFEQGFSKLRFPHSKHNDKPSSAVDVVPYPINWNDKFRFYYFGGFVKGIAEKMNIPLRWGGDWDNDTNVKDQTFMDYPHFELK